MNNLGIQDEQFDDFLFNKRDLGKIIRELTRLLQPMTVTQHLQSKLDMQIALALSDESNLNT